MKGLTPFLQDTTVTFRLVLWQGAAVRAVAVGHLPVASSLSGLFTVELCHDVDGAAKRREAFLEGLHGLDHVEALPRA